jgi:hypothetical protein
MAENDAKGTPQVEGGGYRRADEFYFDYANNIFLEGSVWDLKLVFGQLDQSTNPITTEQRSAVTIPWMQAKILNYLLSLHVLGYEMANGKIIVPDSVIPPEAPPPTEEAKKADPNLVKFYEKMNELREQFFGPQRPLG